MTPLSCHRLLTYFRRKRPIRKSNHYGFAPYITSGPGNRLNYWIILPKFSCRRSFWWHFWYLSRMSYSVGPYLIVDNTVDILSFRGYYLNSELMRSTYLTYWLFLFLFVFLVATIAGTFLFFLVFIVVRICCPGFSVFTLISGRLGAATCKNNPWTSWLYISLPYPSIMWYNIDYSHVRSHGIVEYPYFRLGRLHHFFFYHKMKQMFLCKTQAEKKEAEIPR